MLITYLRSIRYTCQFNDNFSPEYDSVMLEIVALDYKLENVPTGAMIRSIEDAQEIWVTCYTRPFDNYAVYERIISYTR